MVEQDVDVMTQDEVMPESESAVEEVSHPDADGKTNRGTGTHGRERQTQNPSAMRQFGVFLLIGILVGAAVAIPQACSDTRRHLAREAAMSQKSQHKSYRQATSGSDDESHYGFSPDYLLGKPMIYLYPEEETEVSVRLSDPEHITVSYPDYGDDGWRVTAQPDGTLSDDDGHSLYALYYEAEYAGADKKIDEGCTVSRDDIVPFLEESLATCGLTEREAQEMIVWWLPRMSEHRYCQVRFSLTEDEQNRNALLISPKPDHLIRICVVWRGMDELPEEELPEQKLPRLDRDSLDGFVAVEWGGTEID